MAKTKFAIGCLIQWYEADIVDEYLSTLRTAIDSYDGDVLVDIVVSTNEDLEKCNSDEELDYCLRTITYAASKNKFEFNVTADLITIADYRRTFNETYCDKSDILIWGETDMLVPMQMFNALDNLHQNITTPKYIATFGICKMWDDSWKELEHIKFTDKPFIENDYDNWWSLKYTMSANEMNEINSDVSDLDVRIIQKHKFNGCGLVISSEVIKSGVNIPRSVFFVHEDTAFMLMIQRVLGNIPQYHFKNILVVHNRNHPNKRNYIQGETGDTLNKKRRSNDWYVKANSFSEQNCYNIFNPNYKSFTWTDVWK